MHEDLSSVPSTVLLVVVEHNWVREWWGRECVGEEVTVIWVSPPKSWKRGKAWPVTEAWKTWVCSVVVS